MTQKQLSLEIEVGDFINEKYRVKQIFTSTIIAENPNVENEKYKFAIIGRKVGYKKIKTVSRNGKIYYKLLPQGGYRHGTKRK
jgi:lipoate synthase